MALSKHMKRKIREWIQHDLLTEEQLSRIEDYENKQTGLQKDSSWSGVAFILLGSFLIGLGFISLVAYNWNEIPNAFKLLADLFLLLIAALSIYWGIRSDNKLLSESLLLIYALLCLASIGLVSQVYHTAGELHEALVFWGLITSGLFLLTKTLFLCLLWVGASIYGFHSFAIADPALLEFFGHERMISFSLAILISLITIQFRRVAGEGPQTKAFRYGAFAYSFLVLLWIDFSASPDVRVPFLSSLTALILSVVLSFLLFRAHAYSRPQKVMISGALFLALLKITVYFFTFGMGIYQLGAIQGFSSVAFLFCLSALSTSFEQHRLAKLFTRLVYLRLAMLLANQVGCFEVIFVGMSSALLRALFLKLEADTWTRSTADRLLILLSFLSMFVLEIEPPDKDPSVVSVFGATLLASVALRAIFLAKGVGRTERLLRLSLLGSYCAPFFIASFLTKTGFYHAFSQIAFLLSLALLGAFWRRKRFFSLMMVAVGARFFYLYLQAMGDLSYNALVLMVSGIVVVVVSVLWRKYKEPLRSWLEGVLHDD